jgi:hypothetical protein
MVFYHHHHHEHGGLLDVVLLVAKSNPFLAPCHERHCTVHPARDILGGQVTILGAFGPDNLQWLHDTVSETAAAVLLPLGAGQQQAMEGRQADGDDEGAFGQSEQQEPPLPPTVLLRDLLDAPWTGALSQASAAGASQHQQPHGFCGFGAKKLSGFVDSEHGHGRWWEDPPSAWGDQEAARRWHVVAQQYGQEACTPGEWQARPSARACYDIAPATYVLQPDQCQAYCPATRASDAVQANFLQTREHATHESKVPLR